MRSDIRILDDLEAVAQAAASEFISRASRAVTDHGRFTVALSGGSTPKALHAVLVERTAQDPMAIEWSKIEVFFGDERHVPPDHPDSNFRMANDSLLSRVPIRKSNIHRMRCENPNAAQVALEYDRELVTAFQLQGGQIPRFDLILLGMGPDGHTASLFPGSAAVQERNKRVVANWVQKLNTWRVTFTLPVINEAASILLMLSGHDKAAALAEVMGNGKPDTYPVKYVKPAQGDLIWIVDRAAAQGLRAA